VLNSQRAFRNSDAFAKSRSAAWGRADGKSRDTDRFDADYRHLILWNSAEQAIWGAYRLGFGPELYAQGGISSFYLSGFFRIRREAHAFFAQSLEMGRAFVVPEAQLKPMPLYLLWKGIVHVLLRHPGELTLRSGISFGVQQLRSTQPSGDAGLSSKTLQGRVLDRGTSCRESALGYGFAPEIAS